MVAFADTGSVCLSHFGTCLLCMLDSSLDLQHQSRTRHWLCLLVVQLCGGYRLKKDTGGRGAQLHDAQWQQGCPCKHSARQLSCSAAGQYACIVLCMSAHALRLVPLCWMLLLAALLWPGHPSGGVWVCQV